MDDQMIMTRLRAALDEVTAGIGDDPVEIVPVRADIDTPRGRGAWIAAAAATLLLAGGAVWALGSRTPDRATHPASTTPTSVLPAVQAPDAPSFSIDDQRYTPGLVSAGEPFGVGPALPVASWRIEGDGLDGFLSVTVGGAPYEAGDTDQVDTLEAPEGAARLIWPASPNGEFTLPFLEWTRADGSIWTFSTIGLYSAVSSNPWIDLVFEAVPGSGVPVVLPDDRATVVSVGTTITWMSTQSFTTADTPAGSVTITVDDGAGAVQRLVGATEIGTTTVDGREGWSGRLDDGRLVVVWDTGDGWWGTLDISADLADDADAIIASVTRTPTDDQQYLVDARIEEQNGFDVAILPIDSSFQAAYELHGVSWDALGSTTLTADGRRASGPLHLVVRRLDDTTFELVEVRGEAPAPTVPPLCDSYPAEVDELVTALGRLRPAAMKSAGLVSWGVVDDDGSCDRLTVIALDDTTQLRAGLGALADLVDLRFVLTPA